MIVTPHGFSGEVKVKTVNGFKRFDQACQTETIVNETGVWICDLVVYEQVAIRAIPAAGGFVSEDQIFRWGSSWKWMTASQLFRYVPRKHFEGTLFNFSVRSSVDRNHHYILSGGYVAHD